MIGTLMNVFVGCVDLGAPCVRTACWWYHCAIDDGSSRSWVHRKKYALQKYLQKLDMEGVALPPNIKARIASALPPTSAAASEAAKASKQ